MLLFGMFLQVRGVIGGLRLICFLRSEICLELEASIFSSSKITLLFIFDFMRCFFCRVVTLISGRVLLFSSSYIEGDKFRHRFTLIVLRFVISIMLLIFSPRLLSLLLGWDGLGVTSYLLVCYYSSEKRFNARMLTAITNRIGDVLILLFIALNTTPGMFNYRLVRFEADGAYFFIWILAVAAITKRAQIPFSAWLPAAMAAPTPVSALVHSSTLVTAGIYLLIRLNYLLSDITCVLIWLGLLTIFISGFAALIELDIKKIIALSTLSQLGVMMFTIGAGEPLLCWFHLISHAYFKAMLFIGAGSIIHSIRDYQDLRKIGSWFINNQFTGRIFLVGSIRLCGLPFLRGFYSKDSILEQYLIAESSILIIFFTLIATFSSVGYSIRIFTLLFKNSSLREASSREAIGLRRLNLGPIYLTMFSILGGWILFRFSNPLLIVELPMWIKILVLRGVVLTCLFFFRVPISTSPSSSVLSGLHQMWFLPLIIRPGRVNLGLNLSKTLSKVQEAAWLTWGVGGFVVKREASFYSSLSLYSKALTSLRVIVCTIGLTLLF